MFIFDVVVPGQVPPGEIVRNFTEGQDWLVLVEKQEDRTRQILMRRIITLRKIGEFYRRTEEVHHQRLFDATILSEELNKIGFEVEIRESYGLFNLPPARVVLIAHKLF